MSLNKGTEVEVTSDEDGFRGVWYLGKIIEAPKKPNESFVVVEYNELVSEEDESKKLSERVHVSLVRPLPPPPKSDDDFVVEVNDVVDVFHQDGWCVGVVEEVVCKDEFMVWFDDSRDRMVVKKLDVRLHLDWVQGKWEKPKKKIEVPPPSETPTLTQSKPGGVPQKFFFKNRLQEYAQKAVISLPSYQTINEGSDHAPQFRSTVVFDGATYTSRNVFSHRKSAEMDVARIAFLSLGLSRPQIRDETCSLGQEVPPSETQARSKPGAVPQKFLFKNRLQEYAQKADIPLPSYHTINEGPDHAPQFRSTVVFDGATYTSRNVFSHQKSAEMDVARIAFLSLGVSRPQIREETCSLGQEDTIFCKEILNEYAVKINVQNPFYNTEKAADGLFVSSLTFNGKHYVGDKGRNKKESQKLLARTVILSILDSDAGSVISKIINSKKMPSAAKNTVKVMPVQTETTFGISSSKEDKLNVVMVNDNMPRTAIPEPWTRNWSNVLAKSVPLHEFRLPKQEALPNEGNTTPIIFLPPNSEQLVDSTSAKKRKRKSKKSKNKVGIDAQVKIAAVPSSQTTTCTLAQLVPNNRVSIQGFGNAVLSGT